MAVAFLCDSTAQRGRVQIKRKLSHPSQNTSPTSAAWEPSCPTPRGRVRQVLKVAVMSGTTAAAESRHPRDSPEIRFRGCPNQVHFTEPERSTN